MKNVLVANPKGGSGKTTIATNLAGYFAAQNYHVMLADLDRQQSSTYWLERRPKDFPTIMGQLSKAKASAKPQWVISDSSDSLSSRKPPGESEMTHCGFALNFALEGSPIIVGKSFGRLSSQ